MTTFKEWLWNKTKEPEYKDYSAYSAAMLAKEKEQKDKDSKYNTVKIDDIEIQGDEDFINKTKSALSLLSRSNTFQEIKKYLGKIKQHSASGMNVSAKPPTFEVAKSTYSSSPKWYAGSIAHDTYHSYLYHNNQEWNGKKAEQECTRIQIKVHDEIIGKRIIPNPIDYLNKRYLQSVANNPTHQDIPYEKRNW
jgi:hypothetical protein